MTITLELPPDLESRLAAEAAARGLDLPSYAVELLESAAPGTAGTRQRTPVEFDAFAAALAAGSEQLPALATETFTRESFYRGRG